MNQKSINIADFQINLLSETEMVFEIGYEPFFLTTKNYISDINIQCFSEIPTLPHHFQKPVFEAENDTQKFYSIYKMDNDLVFLIYNQQNINEIQQYAVLDESFKNWKIYSHSNPEGQINPLRYPMGPIVMQYLTVKSEAVMIHASCVFDGEKGRIFTGFSGAGKSTMSKIWAEAGNLIINDDRLIIRKTREGYFAYNTPMYYADEPKKAPLSSIFLIKHSPENKIIKLSGALAVSKVLAFCIQNNFDKYFIANNLNFIAELSTQVAVYELGVVPDMNIINYVLTNE
ncbi:MAG: hypothetical protein GZ091_09240 [Paludibacter sp.]|nr:hypothetical protein [Paludibacter sp.]